MTTEKNNDFNKDEKINFINFETDTSDLDAKNSEKPTPTTPEVEVNQVDAASIDKSIKTQASSIDNRVADSKQIDTFYHEQLNKKWSLSDRLLNRSMFKEVQRSKLEFLAASSEYRMRFYNTVLNTQLEAMNEKCNAGIKMIKAAHRHEVSVFVMGKMELLTLEIKNRQYTFLELMKDKHDYADSLSVYPSMQKRYNESILEEELRYLKMLDSIIEKFTSIVNETIKKY